MDRKKSTFKNGGALNLREVAARATLRSARQQGHVYVELRPVGKHSIFFCTLCLTPCFNENVLYAHLKGNLHFRRLASAKITLLLPNPWPFNDGVLFFDNSREGEVSEPRRGVVSAADSTSDHEHIRKCRGVQRNLSISYTPPFEENSNMELKIIGYGHIGAKIHEDDEGGCKFSRIWCAWLGDGNSDGCDESLQSPKCDFAIVNFPYTVNLGRKYSTDDENGSPSPGSFFQTDEFGRRTKRKRKSLSDPEDSPKASMDQRGCNSAMNLGQQKCFRKCDICQQTFLPGRDAATLLNLRTGRFACTSRNNSGAFHVFHISCLIHWVLFCEFELWAERAMNARGTRGRRGKAAAKNLQFSSIFCSECYGTGIVLEGNDLEKLELALAEARRYKVNVVKAQRAWMRSPENLQKCSTGLCFPSEDTVKLQGKVMPGKLLLFYGAGE
ncbi:hypothetical protein KSP39_PZI004826 [Platanthera zijinensis]|uniref:C2H2-type domain-containing protein n=1 Tax=Platanthera zijinensis TaxID=2320716 RepID=A0AAP0GCB9_9ASPA